MASAINKSAKTHVRYFFYFFAMGAANQRENNNYIPPIYKMVQQHCGKKREKIGGRFISLLKRDPFIWWCRCRKGALKSNITTLNKIAFQIWHNLIFCSRLGRYMLQEAASRSFQVFHRYYLTLRGLDRGVKNCPFLLLLLPILSPITAALFSIVL